MPKSSIFFTLLLIVAVSSDRVRMLWKDGEPSKVDIYCKNWDKEAGTCIECYEGCTKWENICVQIVEHCAQWNDQGDCISCQSGYGTLQKKSINGSCPKLSTLASQDSQTRETQARKSSSKTQTTPQKTSTSESQKSKPQLPLIDIYCQCHTQNRECIDCFNGYYLDFNATCQQLPENCTAANELGECTACIKRFIVQNGTCVLQECDFALCTTLSQDQSECTACSYRSYLDNGCCVQVNGFCSKWIESTGECTACYQGYTIDPNNIKQCILTAQ